MKGCGEKKGNQEGDAVSLLILVTGKRQVEVPARGQASTGGPFSRAVGRPEGPHVAVLAPRRARATGPGETAWQNRPGPTGPVQGSSPAHADVSAHGASASCASCLSLSCWHTLGRTTASLLEGQP